MRPSATRVQRGLCLSGRPRVRVYHLYCTSARHGISVHLIIAELNVIWSNALGKICQCRWRECLMPSLLLQSFTIILHNWSKKNSLLEEN